LEVGPRAAQGQSPVDAGGGLCGLTDSGQPGHGHGIPQVRQALGKGKWVGVSLGVTQSPCLPVGTGASGAVGTGGSVLIDKGMFI